MAVTSVTPDFEDFGLRRWTVGEFEAIPDEIASEGERPELIDGLIYTSEQTEHEAFSRHYTEVALRTAFGEGFFTAMRMPLRLGRWSKVEPDVLVLRGDIRKYERQRADPMADVALLVEVSDATLARDQRLKASLYAAQGVAEYWIVNVQNRTLEVRRFSERETYSEVTVYSEDESVPVNGGEIAIAELLPKAG